MAEDLGTVYWKVKADTSELDRAEASMDALGNKAKSAGKDADRLGSQVETAGKKGAKGAGQLSTSADGAAKALRIAATAAAALGVSLGVREIIAYSDAWQSASNQLRLVTNSTQELERVQSSLMQVANGTRSSFESTANLYARLTRATSEMGLSQSELLGITTTINQSFAVSGATAAEAAAAITQLSQGLASGALRGDEFNSVAEQAPGIMRAIADSLKMTVGELRAFAAEGGITADIVVTALQGAAQSIDRDFGKSVQTFGQSMQIARNNMLEFVGSSNAVSTATGKAGEILVALSGNLDVVVSVAGAAATVIGVRLVQSLSAAAVSMGAATTAAGTLSAAMALIGGPIGVAALAAYGMYQWAESTRAANGDTRTFTQTLEDQLEVMERIAQHRTNVYVAGLGLQSQATTGAGYALQQLMDSEKEWERHTSTLSTTISGKTRTMEISAVAAVTMSDKTLLLIDALQNEKKAITMTAREQAMFAAELKALANGDGPEAIETVRRLAAENYDLAESQEKAKDELEAFNASIAEYLKEQKRSREETEKNIKSVYETIGALENEKIALDMTARSAAVFQAVTQATANGALPDQIAQIATLTAELYDMEAAQDATGESAKTAARVAEEAWGRTHDYMSGAFVDLMNNGGNAFDNIAKSFEQMVKRMVAEWAASKLMSVFGMSAPGSSGGGGAGTIASILGSIGKGGGQPGGVAGTMSAGARIGSTVASVGGSVMGAASSAGSALMSAAAAVPGWGWALAAAAAAAAALSKKETPSSNAGFLLRPVGDGDRQFDVPAFDSGFDPVGFARREDQASAVQVIDTFRQYDAALTGIAKAAGLSVNYGANQFGGYSEKGTGSGTFFGTAGESGSGVNSAPIEQQLTQFVGQWIKGLSGQVPSSLISEVLAAGSADEMLARAAMLAGVDGSHATGLNRVPFDGYIAQLHKGERVQTASEAASDDALGSMVAGMKVQMAKQMALLYSIVQRWDQDGLPAERVV